MYSMEESAVLFNIIHLLKHAFSSFCKCRCQEILINDDNQQSKEEKKQKKEKSHNLERNDQNPETQQLKGKKGGKKSSFVSVDVTESYGGSEAKILTTQSEKSGKKREKGVGCNNNTMNKGLRRVAYRVRESGRIRLKRQSGVEMGWVMKKGGHMKIRCF